MGLGERVSLVVLEEHPLRAASVGAFVIPMRSPRRHSAIYVFSDLQLPSRDRFPQGAILWSTRAEPTRLSRDPPP